MSADANFRDRERTDNAKGTLNGEVTTNDMATSRVEAKLIPEAPRVTGRNEISMCREPGTCISSKLETRAARLWTDRHAVQERSGLPPGSCFARVNMLRRPASEGGPDDQRRGPLLRGVARSDPEDDGAGAAALRQRQIAPRGCGWPVLVGWR